jgi:hypothetical protein
MNKVNLVLINIKDFPGFGGGDELDDEEDMPDMKDLNAAQENLIKGNNTNLDDLDEEATK